MLFRTRWILCLAFLTLAVSYTAFDGGGGGNRYAWNLSLLLLGVTGMSCASFVPPAVASGRRRIALWASLAFPVYVAFQLLPLPIGLLRIISPSRAEIAGAVAIVMPAVHLAPISIGPTRTWLHLSRLAAYALVFLVVRGISRRSPDRLLLPALPLILVGGCEAICGLAQHAQGVEAITGSYPTRDHFAGCLELILPFAFMYAVAELLEASHRGRQSTSAVLKACAALSLTAAIYAAIALSLSRMAFISMYGSFFVMGTLAVVSRTKGWMKWPIIAGVACTLLLSFVLISPNALVERFGGLASGDAEDRWMIWRDTLKLIAAYPLFGSGLGTYFPGLLKYQTSAVTFAVLNAHNDYLQLLSELGVIGFVIPVTLMIMVFASATKAAMTASMRDVRLLGLACAGGLTAILLHSLADFNLYVPANAMIFSWIAGLSVSLPIKAPAPRNPRPTQPTTRRPLLVFGALVSAYSIGWLVFLYAFNTDVRAEPLFCRFGICDSDTLQAGLQRQHGVTTVADLSPSEVAELLQRDPAEPYAWEDLGDSLVNAGRTPEARYAYSQAVTLGPHIPYMLYRAAEFFLSLGEYREGLNLMGRTLESDPTYSAAAFRTYDKRHVRIDEILRSGLPNQSAGQAYVRRLIADGHAEAAATAWKWIVLKGWADDKLAAEYVGSFIEAQKPDAAARVWAEYVGERCGDYLKSNYVFNGDFESNLTPSVFDWKLWDHAGFTISIDLEVASTGHRAARIRFDGTENVASTALTTSAFVPVGRYRFQAYVKTDGITTDRNVSFEISAQDVIKPTEVFHVSAETPTGTGDWRLIEREFQVPPNAGLVQIRVLRRPSLKFDNKINGTVWIDQVRITSLND